MKDVVKYNDVELHRNDIMVLRHVDISVDSGEVVYLTGKVGSGKSTLLKSMYAEVPIASGDANVLGWNLDDIPYSEIPYLRREMGIIFQDFRLLSDRSVMDNLTFTLKATGWTDRYEITERAESVLRDMGMLNKGYKFPYELSGGEQQRVVIARALLNSPKLIIADEPTGNLDPATGSHIIKVLHAIAQAGTAVIIATHNMGLVNKFPGRILRFENHTVVE